MTKPNLVLIHGWGASKDCWSTLTPLLTSFANVYSLDLPGFGQTPINQALNIVDYVQYLKKFIDIHKIKNPILIGHSLGGGIAIKFISLYPNIISKLVLINAAIIRRPSPTIIIIKSLAHFFRPLKRFIKTTFDYSKIRNPLLKETFKNIISQDLTQLLSSIKIPTLIFWGTKDQDTPLSQGHLIHSLIKSSKIIIYPNSGHFCYLENLKDTSDNIKNFITQS